MVNKGQTHFYCTPYSFNLKPFFFKVLVPLMKYWNDIQTETMSSVLKP